MLFGQPQLIKTMFTDLRDTKSVLWLSLVHSRAPPPPPRETDDTPELDKKRRVYLPKGVSVGDVTQNLPP